MNINRRLFLKTSIITGALLNSGCLAEREKPGFAIKNVTDTGPGSNIPEAVLDDQTKALLEGMSKGPQVHTMPIEQAREWIVKASGSSAPPAIEIHATEDRTISGPNGPVPIRIYWPGPGESSKPYPVLVLYHGGGFVLGSINTHDGFARYFCKHGDLIVISVDYRLAPEHKFPAGLEDGYAALCWAAEQAKSLGGDPSRLAVIGDSAGGNFAAVMCQMAKRRSGPTIAYQVLLYPSVTAVPEADYPSRKLYGNGEYFLTKEFKKWRRGLYFTRPRQEQYHVMASPILEQDLSHLPQALIITAGFDMLRDEARHYAIRLIESHVPTEYKNYPTTIHGFMSFAGKIDAGKEALAYVSKRLKSVLS